MNAGGNDGIMHMKNNILHRYIYMIDKKAPILNLYMLESFQTKEGLKTEEGEVFL